MMAPADGGRAELDRALVDLWGGLEEVRLKLVDLLARGSLFERHAGLRAGLREYGRSLACVQRGIGELRRGVDHQSGGGDKRGAEGVGSG